MKYNLF